MVISVKHLLVSLSGWTLPLSVICPFVILCPQWWILHLHLSWRSCLMHSKFSEFFLEIQASLVLCKAIRLSVRTLLVSEAVKAGSLALNIEGSYRFWTNTNWNGENSCMLAKEFRSVSLVFPVKGLPVTDNRSSDAFKLCIWSSVSYDEFVSVGLFCISSSESESYAVCIFLGYAVVFIMFPGYIHFYFVLLWVFFLESVYRDVHIYNDYHVLLALVDHLDLKHWLPS